MVQNQLAAFSGPKFIVLREVQVVLEVEAAVQLLDGRDALSKHAAIGIVPGRFVGLLGKRPVRDAGDANVVAHDVTLAADDNILRTGIVGRHFGSPSVVSLWSFGCETNYGDDDDDDDDAEEVEDDELLALLVLLLDADDVLLDEDEADDVLLELRDDDVLVLLVELLDSELLVELLDSSSS